MALERETKLLVEDGVRLPTPDRLMHQLADWTLEEIDQDAMYFDTEDLRLTRAGASVRWRSDDGWTVKVPVRREGEAFAREEHTFEGDAGPPPPGAVDLVRVWIRGGELIEVANIHTHRRKICVYDVSGASVGEVDDDDVRAVVPLPVRFHEIEVEMSDAADPYLVNELVHRLRDAGAGTGEAASKVERVLGDRAAQAPDLVPPRPIDKDSSLVDLVQATIAASVARLVVNDPLVRTTDDPEAIHQARVATRRLRSDLRTLRPVLDARWSEPLRSELSWLGEELGRVRDADVLTYRLEAKTDALTDEQQRGARVLLDRLRASRERDRDALRASMASDRYTRLLDDLVAATAEPKMRHPGVATTAAKAAGRLAARPWKQLQKHVRRLGDSPSDTDLHTTRKKAKQARYALEAIAPVAGSTAAKHAERITELQDILGDNHDAVVAGEWLRDAARDTGDPDVAFAAGLLAASFAADRQRLRAEWQPAWKQIRRRRRYRYR